MVGGKRPGAEQTRIKTARGGRFFQDFQQPIGRGGVQVLRPIDDHDPPAALRRSQRQEAVDLTDILYGDVALQALGFFVHHPLDGHHVGVAAGDDAAEHRVCRVQRQRFHRRLARQQPAREAECQGRLADALRPREQPGVMHSPQAD